MVLFIAHGQKLQEVVLMTTGFLGHFYPEGLTALARSIQYLADASLIINNWLDGSFPTVSSNLRLSVEVAHHC